MPGNTSVRQLLVTQQYHNPDLSTQAKGLLVIKVIFPSLPPQLIKAPASGACFILSSSRKRICCPVNMPPCQNAAWRQTPRGKTRPTGTSARDVESMGWQLAWLGESRGWLCHKSTGQVRQRLMHCVCCNPRFAAWLQATHFICLCLPMTKKTSPAGGWAAALLLSTSLRDATSQPCLKAKSHQTIFQEEPTPLALNSLTA